MAENFSEDRLEEIRDAFGLFDAPGEGSIALKDIGSVLRSLGESPTEKEVQDITTTVETDESGRLDFDTFLHVLARHMKDMDPETELREAFKIFDKENTGHVTAADIRHVLTTMGEVLDDEEVEEFIKEVDTDADGVIDYEEVVEILVSKDLHSPAPGDEG